MTPDQQFWPKDQPADQPFILTTGHRSASSSFQRLTYSTGTQGHKSWFRIISAHRRLTEPTRRDPTGLIQGQVCSGPMHQLTSGSALSRQLSHNALAKWVGHPVGVLGNVGFFGWFFIMLWYIFLECFLNVELSWFCSEAHVNVGGCAVGGGMCVRNRWALFKTQVLFVVRFFWTMGVWWHNQSKRQLYSVTSM